MSGRVHIFTRMDVRDKLFEMADSFDLPHIDLNMGHILQESFWTFYAAWEAKTLTEEQIAKITELEPPVFKFERKIAVFLREGTIKRLDLIAQKYGIAEHDYVHGHFLQMSLEYVYELWKSGMQTEEQLNKLKTVVPPKVVYHN